METMLFVVKMEKPCERTEQRMVYSTISIPFYRDVFMTLQNIYDGAFSRKHLTAFGRELFSQNSSIIDI